MSKIAEASKIQVRAAREAILKAVRGTQKTPLDKNSSEAKKVRSLLRDTRDSRSNNPELILHYDISCKLSLIDI